MITAARVEEILSALAAAGTEWPAAAKSLPEYEKLSPGVPSGPGMCRPWVLLKGPHEDHDCPVRLLRDDELGVWFPKGEYARDTERRAHGNEAPDAGRGGHPVRPWWQRQQ